MIRYIPNGKCHHHHHHHHHHRHELLLLDHLNLPHTSSSSQTQTHTTKYNNYYSRGRPYHYITLVRLHQCKKGVSLLSFGGRSFLKVCLLVTLVRWSLIVQACLGAWCTLSRMHTVDAACRSTKALAWAWKCLLWNAWGSCCHLAWCALMNCSSFWIHSTRSSIRELFPSVITWSTNKMRGGDWWKLGAS